MLPIVHRIPLRLFKESRNAVRTGGPPALVILEVTPSPADCQMAHDGVTAYRPDIMTLRIQHPIPLRNQRYSPCDNCFSRLSPS